jgi:enoyl-CoA hydratase/carnithine racemase
MAIEWTEDGALGFITLNQPPANSYDLAFMDELTRAIDEAEDSRTARVIVFRSASERFFSAGADIKAFQASTTAQNMAMIERAHAALARIATIPKIFIAEVAGHALGGGLEMALACDLRFGSEGAYKLGVPEVTLGLLPGNGGTQRLPRLIGWSRALDLMITGRTLTPVEAHDIGILDRLFPADTLAEQTRAYAESLATGAARAIGTIKLAVHRGLDGTLEDGLLLERRSIEKLFGTADAREGISAFAEKRLPVYSGM